jgi:hypothetical protein
MLLATLAPPIRPTPLFDCAFENDSGALNIVAALKHDAWPTLARHLPNSVDDATWAAGGTRTPNDATARFDRTGVGAGVVGADGAPHAPALIRHTNATIERIERICPFLRVGEGA